MSNFSVLLSVYIKETPENLGQALDSVFRQTLPPDEVILVEDGPLTEELYARIASYRKAHHNLKTVPLQKNCGLGTALNIGLEHCAHNLVARMDTDDICRENRFAEQVAFMDSHPDIDISSAWIQEFHVSNGSHIYDDMKKLPETHKELFCYGKKRCPINHPCAIFRKAAVKRAGGYGPFPEDYYLWARMMVAGCRFHNLQTCLLDFRVNPETFQRRGGWKYAMQEFKCQQEMFRIGYLGIYEFVRNCILRFVVRILPNSVRTFIYKHVLRRVLQSIGR